ncbi:hypothetical protein KHQ06_32890 [Nocardia tengchongensis]|uniref:Uncharacterized protein n=1 Tax=Nocardia tengchongensis TaxID=2055889 RepID=A0ABX8CN65_9NOCA|nr:hypothetical protein [Nocardia tengchongensis]QVI20832.1 hypothetical protein KHQ06_32890 [Nocardia tengchongensis]
MKIAMPQRGVTTRGIGSRGPRRKPSRVLPPNPRDEGLGVLRATMRRHVELSAGRPVEDAEKPDDAAADGRDAYVNRDAYTSSGRDHYVYRPRAEYSTR